MICLFLGDTVLCSLNLGVDKIHTIHASINPRNVYLTFCELITSNELRDCIEGV